MAVDFSLLPSEEVPHDKPPSRFVWTVVFFVMLLCGVFVVLYFWPKNLPTHTAKFWITLVLFPVGIPAWIVLRRYSVYEGRKLDVELRNEAVRAFNERVFQAASIPLALIGAAHRFSAQTEENLVDAIRGGSVTLKHQASLAAKGDTVKARWFVTPDMPTSSSGIDGDRHRQWHITQWLMDELLDDVAGCVQSLPVRVPLIVQLAVCNALAREENAQLWRESWHARALRRANLAEPVKPSPDLMMLDTWLDATLQQARLHATLVIAIHVLPVLAKTPEDSTAEAGAALLLMPEALARKHGVPATAFVHRPVRAPLKQPAHALTHAVQWANVEAAHIPNGWQSQLKANQAGPWLDAAKQQQLAARLTDLDQTVGRAGIAAPWLAMACAAAALTPDTATQLVLATQDTHIDVAVLKHPSPTHTPNPPRRETPNITPARETP